MILVFNAGVILPQRYTSNGERTALVGIRKRREKLEKIYPEHIVVQGALGTRFLLPSYVGGF